MKKIKIFSLLVIAILVISSYSIVYANDYGATETQVDATIYQGIQEKLVNTDEIDYSGFYRNWNQILMNAKKETRIHIDKDSKKEGEISTQHFSLWPHEHFAYNNGYTNWIYTSNLTDYAENRDYEDPSTWPTIAYYTGQSFTKSAQWTGSVGCTNTVISATVGFNVTQSSTVTAATTYTYKIPYMKKGRIVCNSNFKKYSLTCITRYYDPYADEYFYEDGPGSADGPLYNPVYGIQLVSL